jgi:flagellar biosynthesis protein FlhB
MAEESDLEKSEQPSQRRLDQAREKGQVARSHELSTFSILLAGGAALWFMGARFNAQMVKLLHDGMTIDRDLAFRPELLASRLYDFSISALITFSPMLALMLLTALVSPLFLNGWLFSTEALIPQFSRMNPISGIARMFSTNALVELAKAFAKAILVGGVAAWVMWRHLGDALQLAMLSISSAIAQMGYLVGGSFLAIVGGMLLIVAVDVPFQLYSHNKKMMMTKEEVRQEHKETEGNPQIKSRIRSMQREAARRRMMAAIPTADVVVTNPTHYSVALKYSETGMRAPIVVAKGSGLIAQRIREIAQESHVPILEAPPLARALHKHTEIDESIPEALYTAVAEVLAYVYQLKRYQTVGGERPVQPDSLPVPADLDPANGVA